VPFKIGVNVHEIVRDSLPNQFQGLPQYYWNGWHDAATYLLTEKYELDRALKYEDSSIGMEKRYDNLLTKSQILEAMGRKDEAAAAKNEGPSPRHGAATLLLWNNASIPGEARSGLRFLSSGGPERSQRLVGSRRTGPNLLGQGRL